MTREPQITQITLQASTEFQNYHATVVIADANLAAYQGAEDTPNTPGTYFLRSAEAMQRFLKEAEITGSEVVTCGAKWSYSAMLATSGFLVDTENLDRIVELLPGDIEGGGGMNPGLFLAGPGATIAKLNSALEPKGWSLRSSGSHNGPSLAGACATGTHGSVLDFGGTQNHVRGLHIVTGPNSSVWLEPEDGPHLAPAFVRRLDPAIVIQRCDTLFGAALVHLGGLGFVNAVLLQATRLFDMEVVSQVRSIDQRWLELISSGDFDEVARSFTTPGRLYYYELELDPFAYQTDALHTCRFTAFPPALERDFTSEPMKGRLDIPGDDELKCPPRPHDDLFFAYKMRFEIWPKPPESPIPRRKIGTWGQLLGSHVRQIPLYSFAFAIDRKDVAKVVPLICEAVKGQKPYFIFALRFVTEAAGTMAFTRFADSCVINLDGIASSCDPEGNAEQGALLIRAALDLAGIHYSMHWAKLGGLDAAKVSKDFGDPAMPGTKANAWVAARRQLLSPEMQQVFQHDALRTWGLV